MVFNMIWILLKIIVLNHQKESIQNNIHALQEIMTLFNWKNQ
jgi:hypothetical protein